MWGGGERTSFEDCGEKNSPDTCLKVTGPMKEESNELRDAPRDLKIRLVRT